MGRPAKHLVQEFNGVKYYRKPEGYYKADYLLYGVTRYIHRDVWEFHNGPIPEGYEVHHKDEDKANNGIDNLEMLLGTEHASLHAKERIAKNPSQILAFQRAGQEAAKEWHGSKAGRDWHSRHASQVWESKKRTKHTCAICSKVFYAYSFMVQRGFCSASCQGIARKRSGIDDEKRICVICEETFMANKYTRTKTCGKSCWREALSRAHRKQSV